MCFDYGEYATVWRELDRKARKAHRCHECRQAIFPGMTHRFVSGIFDGRPFSHRLCMPCVAAHRAVHDAEIGRGCDDSESWCAHGELADALFEDRDHYGLAVDDDEGEIVWVSTVAAHLYRAATAL